GIRPWYSAVCSLCSVSCTLRLPRPLSSLFPYTTLFRSRPVFTGSPPALFHVECGRRDLRLREIYGNLVSVFSVQKQAKNQIAVRSEEHTSELQSRFDLVCRLLLEKKKEEHLLSTQQFAC